MNRMIKVKDLLLAVGIVVLVVWLPIPSFKVDYSIVATGSILSLLTILYLQIKLKSE